MRRVFCIAVGCIVLLAATASGEVKFGEGKWRLELGGFHTFHNASNDDIEGYFLGSAEYEFPAAPRLKLGLRMYPLFWATGEDDVYGAGAGLAGRVYQRKETYDGFFGELGVSTLWQSREFDANGSRVNFVSEAGLGYKFPKADWHLTLKLQHISNAGLCRENAGINGIGLAAGYTF